MPSGGQRTIGRHVVISLCAACTGCIGPLTVVPANSPTFASALPARGASLRMCAESSITEPLPRRCLHGVHHIDKMSDFDFFTLPRRCLHGVHQYQARRIALTDHFASALPARGASSSPVMNTSAILFASALPARGASRSLVCCTSYQPLPRRCLHGVHLMANLTLMLARTLPRRCLHGVHRQKPTNCGTPFCSIRRESVDSFSEINNKDSCADYFPALFCCQGDLHHHYRQPRTDNRPVLRCEQHRLFLFILSSHYRRLL